ncbi:MAG: pyridoxal-phosphate dependent enzyme [Candidatus Hodgkinia cicadicola]|nr:MAG: pyridoxal-phosphate dependent enzyme [Candidatus Hodgkinia cicadicola]
MPVAQRNKLEPYGSILETVGNTPIVRLKRLERLYHTKTQLLAKLEFLNPLGSIKDRVGVVLIQDAKKKGRLGPNAIIVEPASGNIGIGIASAAASMGLKCVIMVSERITLERKKMLHILGARIVFSAKRRGIRGATKRAIAFSKRVPSAVMPSQFENEASCKAHSRFTAKEILKAVGCVDYVVVGVGTGGTLTGIAQTLKRRCVNTKMVAVEPWKSSALSGKSPHAHKIQGIGSGFVPKILNLGMIDCVFRVKDYEALAHAKVIAKAEGIPVGPSSGAVLCAGASLARSTNDASKRVLMIMPSFAERYAATSSFKL